jgi:hypothetical protein
MALVGFVEPSEQGGILPALCHLQIEMFPGGVAARIRLSLQLGDFGQAFLSCSHAWFPCQIKPALIRYNIT